MRTDRQLKDLSDAEIDLVTGGLHFIGGPIPVPPPLRPQPPGGPILITCIIGKGCMTESA